MAEKDKGKSRKRRHFEIDKSRQSPFQNSFSKPASSTVVSKAPRAINVAEFAESRALEIQNMMIALGNAASVSNKRVFQAVPRHMRRRAASHNSKRMPVRLRDAYNREAAKSQEKMKEPKKKRSRRHRRRPSNLLDEYNRRQRKHVWLETHIWHAKRFKMVEKWGYMIPLHPNDKSIRASYRAMATGCLMQDISFYQCVEVSGRQGKIIAAMKHLTNSDAGLTIAAKQYLNGSREGHVTLYNYDKYPWGAIGPVWFLWQQGLCGGLDVENIQFSEETITADNVVTKLWVWSHPACCDEVLNEIVHACSLEGNTQLTDVKLRQDEETGSEKPEVLPESNTSDEAYELLVTVLREQLVRFRLTGPKSHALLASTMELCKWGNTNNGEGQRWWQSYSSDPAHLKNVTDQNALWELMKGVMSPGVLVSGSVVALVVKDPRLGLPLKKSSVDMASENLYKEQMDEKLTFTSCNTGSAFSPLWDVAVRQEVKRTKVLEKELNDLRSKMLVPGSKLDLGEDMSRIPVLVIQRPGTSGDTKTGSVAFGCGYDVIIPAGWSMAFWIALVYRGARVGGTRELATCLREQALPHFPRDFPDTSAGRECDEEQKRTSGDKHEKYPPAKRPNYDKLGVASPFSGDWERLLNEWNGELGRLRSEMENFISSGNPEETKATEETKISVSDENSLNRVEETPLGSGEMLASPSTPKSFYVIRSHSTRRRLEQISRLLDHAVCSKRTKLSAKDDAFDVDVGFLRSHLSVCCRSLVGLDLRLLSKGCPLINAVIFAPTPEDLRRLNEDKSYGGPVESLHKNKGETGAECGALIGGCTRRAIGYVTSGQYSFARGQGAAVGFCAFPGFCELVFVARRAKCRPLVLLRNTTSFQYRFASFAVV